MTILEKIKDHHTNKKFCKISRKVGKGAFELSSGYIVDYSEHFVLMHHVNDFAIDGYLIFPIQSIKKVRLNNNDKYYGKIMQGEGLINKIENKHKPDLSSWANVFKSIKRTGLNVIVENEDPGDDTFNIGPITKVTEDAVYIRYFDAQGFFKENSDKITWNYITLIQFDDLYTNTFSKYVREKKKKS